MTEKQYPDLPEPTAWRSYDNLLKRARYNAMPITSMQPGVYSHTQMFTEDQMRAYVDADRAMRALQAAPVAQGDALDQGVREELSIGDATPAPIGADALSVAAQVALAEYANPLNWEADENGIRRIWREPDSCTPDAYDGFKLARDALASAAQPQAATDYSACASADSNYAAGMLIGWNLCVAGDEASFGRIREDRMRAAIQASRAAKTTLAGAAQPAAVPLSNKPWTKP